MTDRSGLDDTKILDNTEQVVNGDGTISLKFTLPSGRVVTSTDKFRPGEIPAKVWLAWADSMRAQDSADIEARKSEEAAAASAKQHRLLMAEDRSQPEPTFPAPTEAAASALSNTAESAIISPSGAPVTREPTPEDLIRNTLTANLAKYARLQVQQTKLSEELIATEAQVEKWTLMAATMGIELSEPAPAAQETSPAPITPSSVIQVVQPEELEVEIDPRHLSGRAPDLTDASLLAAAETPPSVEEYAQIAQLEETPTNPEPSKVKTTPSVAETVQTAPKAKRKPRRKKRGSKKKKAAKKNARTSVQPKGSTKAAGNEGGTGAGTDAAIAVALNGEVK